MAVALVRIDDRLIHGQVTTKWIAHTRANRIMIASDKVANDKVRKNIVEVTAPSNIKTEVLTLAEATEKLTDSLAGENHKVFIICTSPEEALALKEGGAEFDRVVVGNMGAMGSKEQAKKITKSIMVTEKDREDFQKLIDLGVKCEIQVIPQDRPANIAQHLK